MARHIIETATMFLVIFASFTSCCQNEMFKAGEAGREGSGGINLKICQTITAAFPDVFNRPLFPVIVAA